MESIQLWQLQANRGCQEIVTIWTRKQHNNLGIELSDTYLALAENKPKLNVNYVRLWFPQTTLYMVLNRQVFVVVKARSQQNFGCNLALKNLQKYLGLNAIY